MFAKEDKKASKEKDEVEFNFCEIYDKLIQIEECRCKGRRNYGEI